MQPHNRTPVANRSIGLALRTLVIAFILVAISSVAQAADLFVSVTGWDEMMNPQRINDCSDPDDPCRSLAQAVSKSGFSAVIKMGHGDFETSVTLASPPLTDIDLVVEGGWNEDFTARAPAPELHTTLSASTDPPTPPWQGGNPNARVIYLVTHGGTYTLTLDRLAIRNGSTPIGGCIYILGLSGPGAGSAGGTTIDVTLQDSLLSDCLADEGGAIAVSLPNAGDAVDQAFDENQVSLRVLGSQITRSISSKATGNAIFANIQGSEIADVGSSGFYLTVQDSRIDENQDGSGQDIHVNVYGLEAFSNVNFERNYLAHSNPGNESLIELSNGFDSELSAYFENNTIYSEGSVAVELICHIQCPFADVDHVHDTILGEYRVTYNPSSQPEFARVDFDNSILGGPLDLTYGVLRSSTLAYAKASIVQDIDAFASSINVFEEVQQAGPDFRPAPNSWAVDQVPCDSSILVDWRGHPRPDAVSGACDAGAVELTPEVINDGTVVPYAGGSDPDAAIYSILDSGCTSATTCEAPQTPTTLEIDDGTQLPSLNTYQNSSVAIVGGDFRDGSLFNLFDDSLIQITGYNFRFNRYYPIAEIPISLGSVEAGRGYLFGIFESEAAAFTPIEFIRRDDTAQVVLLPPLDARLVALSSGRDSIIIDEVVKGTVYVRDQGCDLRTWPCTLFPRPLPTVVVVAADIDSLHLYDSSRASLRRFAVIEGDLVVTHDATMTVSSGQVTGSVGLEEAGALVLNVGGDILGRVYARNESSVEIEEGDFASWVELFDHSTLTVLGEDFEVSGSPHPGGIVTTNSGSISGAFESGREFSFQFKRWTDTVSIELVDVPEPTATLLQAVTLLAVAALRPRRRRALVHQ